MGIVLAGLWYLCTASATIVLISVATALFVVVAGYYLSDYDVVVSFGDAQWVMLCLLIHHIFLSPQAGLMRKIDKHLKQQEHEC